MASTFLEETWSRERASFENFSRQDNAELSVHLEIALSDTDRYCITPSSFFFPPSIPCFISWELLSREVVGSFLLAFFVLRVLGDRESLP